MTTPRLAAWFAVMAILLTSAFTSPALAKYARPELQNVPIERVIQNLKAEVAKNPKNVEALHNLARVEAMAYATKQTEMEISGKTGLEDGPVSPWFGFEPKHVPFELTESSDQEANKAAQKHLAQALDAYEAALKLEPDNLTIQLGRAWCLAQDPSKKEEAISALRKVCDAGWENERNREHAGPGFRSVVIEASTYLLPLIDGPNDEDYRKSLRVRIAKIESIPRAVTPIAIPLAPGVSLDAMIDREANIQFDADGSGLDRRWSWITPSAGWLVYDKQGEGKITSALQLFGNVTFWMFWQDGYSAMSSLDDNADGKLAGNELEHLGIWCDSNRNGACESGEVKPLASYGIVALDCSHKTSCDGDSGACCMSLAGVTFADGTTRVTYDVLLQRKQ